MAEDVSWSVDGGRKWKVLWAKGNVVKQLRRIKKDKKKQKWMNLPAIISLL